MRQLRVVVSALALLSAPIASQTQPATWVEGPRERARHVFDIGIESIRVADLYGDTISQVRLRSAREYYVPQQIRIRIGNGLVQQGFWNKFLKLASLVQLGYLREESPQVQEFKARLTAATITKIKAQGISEHLMNEYVDFLHGADISGTVIPCDDDLPCGEGAVQVSLRNWTTDDGWEMEDKILPAEEVTGIALGLVDEGLYEEAKDWEFLQRKEILTGNDLREYAFFSDKLAKTITDKLRNAKYQSWCAINPAYYDECENRKLTAKTAKAVIQPYIRRFFFNAVDTSGKRYGTVSNPHEYETHIAWMDWYKDAGLIDYQVEKDRDGAGRTVYPKLTDKGKRKAVNKSGTTTYGFLGGERQITSVGAVTEKWVMFSYVFTPGEFGKAAGYSKRKFRGKAKIVYDASLNKFDFDGMKHIALGDAQWVDSNWNFRKNGRWFYTSGIEE